MRVTASSRGRAATGGQGAGRGVGSGGPRGASRPRAQSSTRGRPGIARPAPLARVSSRHSQRDLTDGAPSRRSVCSRMTSGAQAAWAKSWAESPIRRSGDGRPRVSRMGRDRKGSVGAAAGQTPSSSPASTSRSARTSRASMAPRIRKRGWVAPPARTVSPAISRCNSSAKPRALAGGS